MLILLQRSDFAQCYEMHGHLKLMENATVQKTLNFCSNLEENPQHTLLLYNQYEAVDYRNTIQ